MEDQAGDFLIFLSTLLWGLAGAAVAIGIAWRVHQLRRRKARREKSREARRVTKAWREGPGTADTPAGAPPSLPPEK